MSPIVGLIQLSAVVTQGVDLYATGFSHSTFLSAFLRSTVLITTMQTGVTVVSIKLKHFILGIFGNIYIFVIMVSNRNVKLLCSCVEYTKQNAAKCLGYVEGFRIQVHFKKTSNTVSGMFFTSVYTKFCLMKPFQKAAKRS